MTVRIQGDRLEHLRCSPCHSTASPHTAGCPVGVVFSLNLCSLVSPPRTCLGEPKLIQDFAEPERARTRLRQPHISLRPAAMLPWLCQVLLIASTRARCSKSSPRAEDGRRYLQLCL